MGRYFRTGLMDNKKINYNHKSRSKKIKSIKKNTIQIGEDIMVEDKVLIEASYVSMSKKRLRIIELLHPGEVLIPRDIAKGTDISPNHVSKVLHDLKDHELIVCINEEAKKGRLYRLTPLGLMVKDYLTE